MAIPNKNQYIETIRNGVDYSPDWRGKNVVLNFDGTFEINYNYKADDRYNYIGRGERLDNDNGYVGFEAAADERYINRSYAMFLNAWISYIKSGTHGQFLDIFIDEDKCEEIETIAESVVIKSDEELERQKNKYRKYIDEVYDQLNKVFCRNQSSDIVGVIQSYIKKNENRGENNV